MATAESHISIPPERRRSERWPLALPVLVCGTSLDSRSFQENTITLSVSTHGALVALSTTVTLGQPLLLRNPQTQQESEAWVSRFGHPRGGLAQVGIAFVHPEEGFWSTKPAAQSTNDSAPESINVTVDDGPEERADDRVLMFSNPAANRTDDVSMHRGAEDEIRVSEATSSSTGPELPEVAAPETQLTTQAMTTQASASGIAAPARSSSPGVLLQALEQTLRQAADHAVAASATASLGPAVNHAAATIENFSQDRIRQIEELLAQRRDELMASAREDVFAQVQAAVAQSEEQLKRRLQHYIEEVSSNAHRDFADRLNETANQVALKFSADAVGGSAQHFAQLADGIHAAAAEAQARLESTAAGMADTHANAKDQIEQAVAETQQKFESLNLLLNGAFANCDARVRAFQEDLALSRDRELESFRERLRTVLSTLLNALG